MFFEHQSDVGSISLFRMPSHEYPLTFSGGQELSGEEKIKFLFWLVLVESQILLLVVFDLVHHHVYKGNWKSLLDIDTFQLL